MPTFVPRQRKHKVIARLKSERAHHASPEADSNAIEHTPASLSALEEKKKRLEAELQSQGLNVNSKKAKRLEKYIDSKLKKDENRQLIEKLANSRVDTTLYQSSRKLGQGRETKRDLLSRTFRESQAGIDIGGDNEGVLFERKVVKRHTEDASDTDETDVDKDWRTPGDVLASGADTTQSSTSTGYITGMGLKRPLEVDDEGKPLLKKRKRRGGVKSKLSFKHEDVEEPPWEGFSSGEDSNWENSGSDKLEVEGDESDEGETQDDDSAQSTGESQDDSDEKLETENSPSEDIESSNDGEAKQERSSAFKAWATQKRNEAQGYHSEFNIQDMSSTLKVENFTPRAPESDPLPLELQIISSVDRKAFSVSVIRSPEIQAARLQLPVVAEEQKIMEAMHNNKTVVLYGATGSGKTTQVPQFLYEAGYGSPDSPTPGMIGITQPRRVAAVSMSRRVGEELGDHGNRVAYQIRFEGTVSPKTAIKFMTDGVLLREVAQDIALRKYSAIIIDEAHERSVNTDILIGTMSRVVRLREQMAQEDSSMKPLKLIIMSATLKVTDFTENTTLFPIPPLVLQAEGRQYHVTNHFSRKTHHNYVEEVFRKICKGHRQLPPGGFLVFLTGQNEIVYLSKRLKEAFRIGLTASGPQVRISGQDAPIEAEDVEFGDIIDDDQDSDDDSVELDINNDDDFDVGEVETGPTKMHILPLYSLLPTREQLKVFEPSPDGARLVVLATNVAETSLTIPGIRYVFDCGRSKERKYEQQTGVQSFEIGWISKASAIQRAGRAGRTGPGHCYRIYSSAVYERDFEEFAEPEILRMPIEGVVLQLKAMNLQHVVNFPFPTPPDRQSLANSERLLTYLSAISPTGQITSTGITMSIFPLSPRFARILLIGHLHNCLLYTIALVAALSAAEVFIPENQAIPTIPAKDENDSHFTNEDRIAEDANTSIRRQYNKVHKQFTCLESHSDAIKLLQVVGEYAHEPTESWCQSHFVRSKPLKEISLLRRQIADLLRTNVPAFAGLKHQDKLPPPSTKQVNALKQMVASGFIDHVAIRADLAPSPPTTGAKPKRAIEVPYLTLLPSSTPNARRNQQGQAATEVEEEEDKAVYIHPSSPLAHLSPKECPEYIIYNYLQRPNDHGHGHGRDREHPTPPEEAAGISTRRSRPRTRMRALTDITGAQLAALAKGTPLLTYGKPIKEVKRLQGLSDEGSESGNGNERREVWVIPFLRAEGKGGVVGWPLPARRIEQRRVVGRGWVEE